MVTSNLASTGTASVPYGPSVWDGLAKGRGFARAA
jgi:hypothetical protein